MRNVHLRFICEVCSLRTEKGEVERYVFPKYDPTLDRYPADRELAV